MIDASSVRYDLVAITPQGQRLHLQEVLEGLMWEEQPGELAARLQFTMHNRQVDGKWLHSLVPLGGQVMLYADWGQGWEEVFRGTNFGWNYRKDPTGRLTVTAYDMLYQLTKSRDNRWYTNGTMAKVIIEDIAKAWGIPLGTVEGPDVKLAKQAFKRQRVADMVFSVLDQAKKRGAGKFIVQAEKGKMNIIKPGQNTPVYHFGQLDSAGPIDDQQDIEQLVTRVKIIGAEDKQGRAPVEATVDGKTEFGTLQEIVYREEYDTPAAAKQAAKEILDERGKPRKRRKVTTPDLPFMRKGHKVHISAGTLNGYFIVTGVQHDADNRMMTLEVEEYAG